MEKVEAYRPAPDLLKDRVILVTGASRGIGRMAALAYARHGATVALHGRDVQRLEAVYDEIEAAGGAQSTIVPLDLATAGDRDYDNIAQAIQAQLHRLDGILHNASHFTDLGPLENARLTEWLDLMRVNLLAPVALTRACAHLTAGDLAAAQVYAL